MPNRTVPGVDKGMHSQCTSSPPQACALPQGSSAAKAKARWAHTRGAKRKLWLRSLRVSEGINVQAHWILPPTPTSPARTRLQSNKKIQPSAHLQPLQLQGVGLVVVDRRLLHGAGQAWPQGRLRVCRKTTRNVRRSACTSQEASVCVSNEKVASVQRSHYMMRWPWKSLGLHR